MDSKIIHATCMRAAVTVIATGVAIIEQERNTIYIPREPCINAIAQRELYIDSIEGFDEIILGDAFDHLVQNEMLAKAFMTKNVNLRKIWVQNFVNHHYYRPAC